MRLVNWMILLASLAIISCEKVIELPLNEAGQRVVVEAVVKDQPGNNYVWLSRSGSVYESSDFEKIEDAIVTVTDNFGNVYSLEHEAYGGYFSEDLEVVPGRSYELSVQVDGEFYTATSKAKSKPKIDSLSYYRISGQFGVPADDTVNLISFHTVDNPAEKNFYWMKIFRNGAANSGYYLGNDNFINGSYFEASFFGSEAKNGDTVLVEMISIDQANYNYLIGLANALTSGPFAVAPANPPSNISNDALGFFGAYSIDTMSIIIPY